MSYKEEGSIFSIESLNEKVFRLKIFSPNIAQKALPGNFCHLRVNQTYFPLLRRAFSFHSVHLSVRRSSSSIYIRVRILENFLKSLDKL